MPARKSHSRKLELKEEHLLPGRAGGPAGNVMYFRPEAEDREFEDILLRRVPRKVAHRFRGAAGARALTHAQYLSALVALHERMRDRAQRDAALASELDKLGLRTVSI